MYCIYDLFFEEYVILKGIFSRGAIIHDIDYSPTIAVMRGQTGPNRVKQVPNQNKHQENAMTPSPCTERSERQGVVNGGT